MSKGAGKGSNSSLKGAKSLGAAAGSYHPNGAILDDTAEILKMQSQRFKAWAAGYRDKKLKANEWFSNMSMPMKKD